MDKEQLVALYKGMKALSNNIELIRIRAVLTEEGVNAIIGDLEAQAEKQGFDLNEVTDF